MTAVLESAAPTTTTVGAPAATRKNRRRHLALRVLAVVVTFGYAAFLVGPAVVGLLVRHVGIHHAMAVPAVLCAGIIALAATMPRSDRDLAAH